MSDQTQTPEITAKPNTAHVTMSCAGMSNRQYHAAGKPVWWARVDAADGTSRFLTIPRTRGDEKLSVKLYKQANGLKAGDRITIGVGPNDKHGCRCSYTVKTAA